MIIVVCFDYVFLMLYIVHCFDCDYDLWSAYVRGVDCMSADLLSMSAAFMFMSADLWANDKYQIRNHKT